MQAVIAARAGTLLVGCSCRTCAHGYRFRPTYCGVEAYSKNTAICGSPIMNRANPALDKDCWHPDADSAGPKMTSWQT